MPIRRLASLSAPADLFQRNGRRVGRHDGVRLHHRLRRGEDLLLDIQPFGNRLDDKVGRGQPPAGRVRRQS